MSVHREDETVKSVCLITLTAWPSVLVARGRLLNHDGNEWERVVCEVESVNGGSPLVSAYVDRRRRRCIDGFEPDDVFTIDWSVHFKARPYSLRP